MRYKIYSRYDLSKVVFEGDSLVGATLQGADFRYADLHDAYLQGADLRYANLQGADLRYANLQNADLQNANLRGANLRYADLRGANLRYANLQNALLPNFQILPQEGSVIVWKKLKGDYIAKLRIPAGAERTSSLVGRKCRAEYVKVLAIYDDEGNRAKNFEGVGTTYDGCVYKEGETVYPDKYDGDIRVECTNGIHVFLTRKEAEEWR